MALLPANVLIVDPSSAWLRIAVPFVLEQDLTASKSILPFFAKDESAAYQLNCLQTLRVTVEQRPGGLSLWTNLIATPTQQARALQIVRPGSDFITQLNSLAKQIDPAAEEFSTRDEQALRDVALGLMSPAVPQQARYFNEAINADPHFGLAYILLLETFAKTGSADQIAATLRNAESHRGDFTRLDGARFDFFRSRLLHEAPKQEADAALALLSIAPNSADALGSLGSYRYLQGNTSEAGKLLSRAIELDPLDAALRQRLISGLVAAGQFAQAEKMLSSLGSEASAQLQLAACILLSGDATRAAGVFDRFVSSMPDPDAKLLFRASWLALSGKPQQAVTELDGATFRSPQAARVAANQVALWKLLPPGTKAIEPGSLTQLNANSGYAQILAAGAKTAADWRSTVASIPDSSIDAPARQMLSAYGLFLLGFYDDAAAAWRQIDQQSGDTDLRARTMLAASLNRAGKSAEARQLRILPFLPDLNDYYAAVSFNELRRLLHQTG